MNERPLLPSPILPIPRGLVWIVSIGITVLLAVALGSLAVGFTASNAAQRDGEALTRVSQALKTVQASQSHSDCIGVLTGDFDAAVARAFLSPPAPNDARLLAAQDILRSADRITHSDTVCAHGVPKPLVPTHSSKG